MSERRLKGTTIVNDTIMYDIILRCFVFNVCFTASNVGTSRLNMNFRLQF